MRSVESLNKLLSTTECAMLRKLRSLTGDTKSVAEVIGIILIVTLSLVVAVTLHAYLGNTANSNRAVLPMVSLKQNGNSLMIVDIQFGPVHTEDLKFKAFGEDGLYVCDGVLNSAEAELLAGNTISFPFISGGSYTVLVIYLEQQVGEAAFVYK